MSDSTSLVLHHSDVESRRFGLRIARGVVGVDEKPDQICADIAVLRPDIAIFRCNAGDTRQIDALVSAGLVPRHADTLLYYRIGLHSQTVRETLVPEVRIEQASAADVRALESIVRSGFDGYRNHYHANPLLSPAAILDGYVEWALDYVLRPGDEKQTWVSRVDGQARTFVTCRVYADRSEVEIILNATDPDWAGRGLYSALLRFLIGHYRQLGLSALVISTQVWNYDVQRVWSRTGLVLDRAFDTYHVNVPRRAREAHL